MKRIIDISEEEYKFIKDLQFYSSGRRNGKTIEKHVINAIKNSTPYNPSGDLISREALKEELKSNCKPELCHDYNTAWCESCCPHNDFEDLIDNAPTVEAFTKEDMSGAYNEGYMCGNKEAEKARPKGEYVDISKLRLMTVEECEGHTIEYAMGWKACIEWIKKGGAE